MSQKSGTPKSSSERIVKDIRRATRKQYSAEEKIRIVLDGLRGEHSISELCRREGRPSYETPAISAGADAERRALCPTANWPCLPPARWPAFVAALTWAFMPKYNWLPFLVWCMSGSWALSAFLVEDGALMIVASTMVPVETFNPSASRCR
jgi:hypothetical protein